MRYAKVFMIIVTLMLIIPWSIQVDAGGKSRRVPAPIPQTGQTDIYHSGDDGDLQMGILWPDPRFTDHGDGTVTDNLTGLIWTKNAQEIQVGMIWPDAVTACNNLVYSGRDAWRLPNLRELQSLIDYGHHAPALPADHPFTDVQFYFYWSSTTNVDVAAYPSNAWGVRFNDGYVIYSGHEYHFFVWCVRGGQ